MSFDLQNLKIGVIGLGYVGLPLAVEFGKHYATVGFDVDDSRIAELNEGRDATLEVTPEDLVRAERLDFATSVSALTDCNFFIVTVPTPVSDDHMPVLAPLKLACRTLAVILKPGDVVVFESTVYPGATEEDCVPILEEGSGLKLNSDFYVGYSPERINPGDKQHTFTKILKVVSGSTPEASEFIERVYGSVVEAGTYQASSIKVAEAAKVIENTQRDVNIALVNELAMIFERVGIDTEEVLEAAGTKWNFLPFRPGLVGGHCIGVDPYYLTYKAQKLGYNPEMILAGRRINDNMPIFVVSRIIKNMIAAGIQPRESRALVLGLTFKENCPDLRNTKVVDIIDELASYGLRVDVHDPWAAVEDAQNEYGIDLVEAPQPGRYEVIVVAVAHDQFREMGEEGLREFGKSGALLYDTKYLLSKEESDDRL